MREITDNPDGDGGDLSDDQVQKFDELKAELDRNRKTDRAPAAARRCRAAHFRAGDHFTAMAVTGNFENRAREFSLVKAILHRLGEDVDSVSSARSPAEVRRRAGRSFAGIAVPDEYFQSSAA